MGRLNELYAEWRERVHFFCVYIQEAHPEDGWQVDDNVDEGVVFAQPRSTEERAQVAQTCVLRAGVQMPLLLDGMDNEIDRLYAALPERLYVLDREGVVRWKSVMGSGGFDVEAFARAIAQIASR